MLKNVQFIEGCVDGTVQILKDDTGVSDRFHFTNGTYAAAAEIIVPTTLDGFKYISDEIAEEDDIFVIAVNSDSSMEGIMEKKEVSFQERANLIDDREAELSETETSSEIFETLQLERDALNEEIKVFQMQRENLEDQFTRGMKVADPLAEANPDRPIYIVFYDEETPTELYNAIKAAGLNFASLHKHGYGTDKDAPRIEGAHNAERVIAYPFPNNSKPLCHDITIHEDQSRFVEVVDLSKVYGERTAYTQPVPQIRTAPMP